MKKLLLATIFAAGSMIPMAAQDLVFQTADGTNITGTTYVFEGEPEEFPQGDQTEVFLDPDLYIYSPTGGDIVVSVKANVSIQLCIGGGCEAGFEVSKEATLKAGVAESLLYDYSEIVDLDEYVLPLIEAEISAWYKNEPDKVITMTVKMGDVNAGVEAVGAALNAVNFNGKALNYDVNGASQLSVYSLSGKTVLNKSVAGTGSVALDGLSKGIYLYRLTNKNGKTIKSAKIIVK